MNNYSENNENNNQGGEEKLTPYEELLAVYKEMDYLKLEQFLENPAHTIRFKTDFILSEIKRLYKSLEIFCFRFSIRFQELKKVLCNEMDFDFRVLIKIALTFQCKVKDLFDE